MRKLLTVAAVALVLSPGAAMAASDAIQDKVLLLRHALLVGGRDASQVPLSGEARSAQELAKVLVDWEPGEESEEIRELFALEGLSEVVRQALVLPASGGQSNSVYVHDGVSFELRFKVWPDEEDVVTAEVEIRRDGAWLAAPTVKTLLGERAIVSTTNGPEAPFLFLVVEVDRVSRKAIEHRGLRYAGRENLMTVGGEVHAPRAISKAPPMYTEKARKERVQGPVILRLVIDETGEVSEVEVLKGLPYGLTETAIAAVEEWTFEPAT
ncbi:MAG: energy transducer TonB, partial [Thermoanaerobaculia bacterium]